MKKCAIHIIGTGPYGLGIANSFYEKGIEFEITGNPLTLWYHHTLDTMSIRSDYHTSEIFSPSRKYNIVDYLYKRYPDSAGEILKDRLPVDIFRGYLRYVQESLPYSINTGLVTKLEKDSNSFIATLESGEVICSEKVIIATGIGAHKYLPECLKNLDGVLHGWDVGDYASLEDKNILVIGAGQSAAESVAHLKDNNRVSWMMRKKPIYYTEPLNLPTWAFNFFLRVSPWFYFLPDPLRKRFGKKYVIATITPDMREHLESEKVESLMTSIEDMDLIMEEGSIKSRKFNTTYDSIVAATGFRYNIDNLRFISGYIRSNIKVNEGIPILSYDFETSVKNLYMVGGIAEPEYGPAQRFMMGAKHAALRMLKVCRNMKNVQPS